METSPRPVDVPVPELASRTAAWLRRPAALFALVGVVAAAVAAFEYRDQRRAHHDTRQMYQGLVTASAPSPPASTNPGAPAAWLLADPTDSSRHGVPARSRIADARPRLHPPARLRPALTPAARPVPSLEGRDRLLERTPSHRLDPRSQSSQRARDLRKARRVRSGPCGPRRRQRRSIGARSPARCVPRVDTFLSRRGVLCPCSSGAGGAAHGARSSVWNRQAPTPAAQHVSRSTSIFVSAPTGGRAWNAPPTGHRVRRMCGRQRFDARAGLCHRRGRGAERAGEPERRPRRTRECATSTAPERLRAAVFPFDARPRLLTMSPPAAARGGMLKTATLRKPAAQPERFSPP